MVVNIILKRLKELTNGNEVEYNNYIKKVNVLSNNRNLKKEVKKEMNNMLNIDITKTPLYEIGVFDTAIIMVEKFKLSIDDIAKELNIKKEELIEYMKEKKEKEV